MAHVPSTETNQPPPLNNLINLLLNFILKASFSASVPAVPHWAAVPSAVADHLPSPLPTSEPTHLPGSPSFLQVSFIKWNITGEGPCCKSTHMGHLEVISPMHEMLLQVTGGFWALIPTMTFLSPFLKKYESQTAVIQSFLLRYIFARKKKQLCVV